MNRRTLGIGLITAGTLLVVVAVLGATGTLRDDGATPLAEPPTAVPDEPRTSAPTPAPTAAPDGPDASPAASRSPSPPPSPGPSPEPTPTSPEPTPTPPEPTPTSPGADVTADDVLAYVEQFRGAVDRGDVDGLLARLHPAALSVADEATCRAFVEREILALDGYVATGPASGPTRDQFGDVLVERLWTVPVSFTFQGEAFSSEATYAGVDGDVHWFAACR